MPDRYDIGCRPARLLDRPIPSDLCFTLDGIDELDGSAPAREGGAHRGDRREVGLILHVAGLPLMRDDQPSAIGHVAVAGSGLDPGRASPEPRQLGKLDGARPDSGDLPDPEGVTVGRSHGRGDDDRRSSRGRRDVEIAHHRRTRPDDVAIPGLKGQVALRELPFESSRLDQAHGAVKPDQHDVLEHAGVLPDEPRPISVEREPPDRRGAHGCLQHRARAIDIDFDRARIDVDAIRDLIQRVGPEPAVADEDRRRAPDQRRQHHCQRHQQRQLEGERERNAPHRARPLSASASLAKPCSRVTKSGRRS